MQRVPATLQVPGATEWQQLPPGAVVDESANAVTDISHADPQAATPRGSPSGVGVGVAVSIKTSRAHHKEYSKRLVESIVEDHTRKSKTIQVLEDYSPLRQQVTQIVQHKLFGVTVAVLIVANGIYIGVETEVRRCEDSTIAYHWFLTQLAFSCAFLVELALRLFSDRIKFFRDQWNLFDLFLVVVSVFDTAMSALPDNGNAQGSLDQLVAFRFLRFLRLLRVARILRLLRFLKELWFLVEGIVAASRTLAWAWILILCMTYMPAIFATRVLGKAHPDKLGQWFGTVPRSMYTLFQVMTMDGWSNPARASMEVEPWSWLLFVGFIFATTFAVMHVVVAVIVQNVLEHASHRQEDMEGSKEQREQGAVVKIMEVFQAADVDGDGELTKEEFIKSLEVPQVIKCLLEVKIDVRQAENLFDILDYDESGSLDAVEFIDGVLAARGQAQARDVLAVQCDMWKAELCLDSAMDTLEGTLLGVRSQGDQCLRSWTRDLRLAKHAMQELRSESIDECEVIDHMASKGSCLRQASNRPAIKVAAVSDDVEVIELEHESSASENQ